MRNLFAEYPSYLLIDRRRDRFEPTELMLNGTDYDYNLSIKNIHDYAQFISISERETDADALKFKSEYNKTFPYNNWSEIIKSKEVKDIILEQEFYEFVRASYITIIACEISLNRGQYEFNGYTIDNGIARYDSIEERLYVEHYDSYDDIGESKFIKIPKDMFYYGTLSELREYINSEFDQVKKNETERKVKMEVRNILYTKDKMTKVFGLLEEYSIQSVEDINEEFIQKYIEIDLQ